MAHTNAYRIKSAPWLTAVTKSDLSKNARLVAMALFASAGVEGDRCFPGLDTLSERSCLIKSAITKARAELVAAGYLDVSSSKGGRGNNASTYYTLTVPEDVARTVPGALVTKPIKTREQHIEARNGVVFAEATVPGPDAAPVPVQAPEVPEGIPAPVVSLEARREAGRARGEEYRRRAALLIADRVAPLMDASNAGIVAECDNAESDWWPLRDVVAKYLAIGMDEDFVISECPAALVKGAATAKANSDQYGIRESVTAAAVHLRGALSGQMGATSKAVAK